MFCKCLDSSMFLAANYGIDDSVNDSAFGYVFAFLAFHTVMTYVGLHFSTQYILKQSSN
jgi:hypothetical protein